MVNYRSLIGRQWDYGTFDCYTLIRDYCKLRGIIIPDFDRPDDLETCQSVFLEQADAIGFKAVAYEDRQPDDILIMRLGTKEPMHAAILLPSERILHQRQDSLSAIEPLSRYYMSRVAAVFRYDTDRQAAG